MTTSSFVSYPHIVMTSSGSPFVTSSSGEPSSVPVRRIYDWYRKGIPAETLIKRYPSLGAAKVLSALAFAHDNMELILEDLEKANRVQEGPFPQVPLPFQASHSRLPGSF